MRSHPSDLAFTGLEAAIVLIAFIIVSAVFSYVVLGAGFFTTQLSQKGVYSGVQGASSTLQLVGTVYGIADTPGGPITNINFSIDLAPGGIPVDFSRVAMTYSNSTQFEPLTEGTKNALAGPGHWTIADVDNELTSNQVLEKGETFDINIHPSTGIIRNDVFDVAVQPSIGASMSIHRIAPASIQLVNILY